jgi:hypothetical protein
VGAPTRLVSERETAVNAFDITGSGTNSLVASSLQKPKEHTIGQLINSLLLIGDLNTPSYAPTEKNSEETTRTPF